MDEINLDSSWIVENKELFPWRTLIGAKVSTREDRVLIISDIEERDWPHGPLLETHYSDEPASESQLFNIVGFESGRLKTITPSPINVPEILSFINKVEERHKEETERERHKKVSELDRVKRLNASRRFDLILFDLDDTLVGSSHLERFRGRGNVGNTRKEYVESLAEEANQLQYLIPERFFEAVRKSFPELKLGIFTRAPKSYAETILKICYPSLDWDCLITYESVSGKTKPKPDGVFKAAKETGVTDFHRIALVGDTVQDIQAAYQAGIFAVLYRKGWGAGWKDSPIEIRRDHYSSLDLHPDAIIDSPSAILRLITSPEDHLPTLESWDAVWAGQNGQPGMRLDNHNHFNNLNPQPGRSDFVQTKVMARYFVRHHGGTRFDYGPKSTMHRATQSILEAKEGVEFPESWVACCSAHISSILENTLLRNRSLIVCPVPAKPGRPARLERLIERINLHMGSQRNLFFDIGVLSFKQGVTSNKSLSSAQRFVNIRNHLEVANPDTVKGNEFIVMDDVTTSGATLYFAEKYLKAAGARSVQCIALTQTVSGNA